LKQAPPHYSPRPSPVHGCNPKLCRRPAGSGHRAVLTNPVRCWPSPSRILQSPISPSSLDSRCSAFGCALGAPFNGQSIHSGRQAAVFHRSHHSNEHPVGETKIRHAEGPASAAGTALSLCYLLPPHACSRHKLLAPGPPTADVLAVSLLTTPSERTRKSGPLQPEHAMWSRASFCKSKLAFWRNRSKGR
jgi:hypothetical protein